MKIIITGINGFIGSNIRDYLDNYYTVGGVSREPDYQKSEISWKTFYNTQINSEIWIHLAGIAHDFTGKFNKKDYIDTNVDITTKVFNKFLNDSKSEKFIFFSSVKAAASKVDDTLYEEDRYKLDSYYGESKRYAEDFLLKQKISNDKKLIILRPCMIHGKGNKGNINLLHKFINKGFPYPLAKFKNNRSFLSIDNLLYIIKKIIENKSFNSGIYNVADDGTLSTNTLVRLIANSTSSKSKLLHINKNLINSIGKLCDLFHLPFNSYHIEKLTESYIVSNRKIKLELGLDKFPLSIEEGIIRTIKGII